jgi:serine/threonine protein kinase
MNKSGFVPLPIDTLLLTHRYRVLSVVGIGGFAITYKGSDNVLSRQVAIKELYMEGCSRVGNSLVPSLEIEPDWERAKNLIKSEASTLAQLKHPNIVTVFDYFEENLTVYMVTEFIDGVNLKREVMMRGAMTAARAVSYAIAIGEALALLHKTQVIHRDVNPNNIMLTREGHPVLIY